MDTYLKKKYLNIIKYIVSISIIFFIFRSINLKEYRFTELSNYYYILVAALLYILGFSTRVIRWKLILNKNDHIISFLDCFKISLIGISLNYILPATGGDIGKFYFAYKKFGNKENYFISTVIDKVFALISIFILGGAALIYSGFWFIGSTAIIGSIAVSILSFYLPGLILKIIKIFFKKKINTDIILIKLSMKHYLLYIFISILGWIIIYFEFWYLFKAFNINIDILSMLILGPIYTFSKLFPFTVEGLGVSEGVWIYFSKIQNIPESIGLISAFICRIINSVIPAIIGIYFIIKFNFLNNNE